MIQVKVFKVNKIILEDFISVKRKQTLYLDLIQKPNLYGFSINHILRIYFEKSTKKEESQFVKTKK